MKIKISLFVCISLFLFNCKNEIKTDSTTITQDKVVNSHDSKNSLDWQGTYKGIMPCADCEGIETEITLNKDITFILRTKYLGKGDSKIFEEKGKFSWDESGTIITLENLKDRPNKYKVGENTLTQLDMNGKIITGALAKMYIFKK